jgi:hypothetical protein
MLPTMTGKALYVVTLRYIAENGIIGNRSMTVPADNADEALRVARDRMTQLVPAPRAITSSTAIRMKEPAR